MYDCKILADTSYRHPMGYRSYRFTTFEVTAPRFLLAEVNTHRMLSRNSASSRAIPVGKAIHAVAHDPFIPEAFRANKPGMQPGELLNDADSLNALGAWNDSLDQAIKSAAEMDALSVHKGWANRLLEPFKWQTMVISGTDWSNFFALRNSPEAQPEFEIIAKKMQRQYEHTNPVIFDIDRPEQWHRPYVTDAEIKAASANYSIRDWNDVSVGRCARVSTGTTGLIDSDIMLARERLAPKGHVSPFEHVARPFNSPEWGLIIDLQEAIQYVARNGTLDGEMPDPEHADYLHRMVEYRGNHRGWHSARADLKNEHDYSLINQ